MDPATIHFLQNWQPAISAVLGFTGVIIALVVNAWLARRQVRDHREHERLSIARALAAELQALEHAANITVAPVRDHQTYGTLHPPIIMMPVSRSGWKEAPPPFLRGFR